MSTQHLEEAAAIASEFISSLDNLPSEVQHILQEIRHKEKLSQELQMEVARDCNKYTRHALRPSSPSVPSTPVSSASPTQSPTISSSRNGHHAASNIPHKDLALLAKIDTNYAEVDRLAEEKIKLAERIVILLTRTRSRLDVELSKVNMLQGDVVADGIYGYGGSFSSMNQINDNLKGALSPAPGSDAGTPMPAHKRRKLMAQGTLKLHPSSSMPLLTTPGPSAASTPQARSRLGQSRSNRRAAAVAAEEDDLDLDAEGEEDEDADGEGEDGEDKGLYCFCQQLSHGEMVACDNPACPYQWFHIGCVNLKAPLPDRYFCAECVKNGFGIPDSNPPTIPGRKGRKKA